MVGDNLDLGALKENLEKTRAILLADDEKLQSEINSALAKSALGGMSKIVMRDIDERRRLQAKFSSLNAEYRRRIQKMLHG